MTYKEPNNLDRAAWAETALDAFRAETGTDREDAVCDLLCDLMHLCAFKSDIYGDFNVQQKRGAGHFQCETEEDLN